MSVAVEGVGTSEPVVYITVSGEQRAIYKKFWDSLEGPKPPGPDFDTNGCTCSPDYLEGKPIWPACVIHDFAYNGAPISRADADAVLRRNVFKILREEGMGYVQATAVSWAYWFGVRKAGRRFYNGPLDPR